MLDVTNNIVFSSSVFFLLFFFSSGFWRASTKIQFTFKFNIIPVGVVPRYIDWSISWSSSKTNSMLEFPLCVKQSDIDVVTFATDLRAPFMVISPGLTKVSVNTRVPI